MENLQFTIRKRDHGFKFHPKGQKGSEYYPRPLVYKAGTIPLQKVYILEIRIHVYRQQFIYLPRDAIRGSKNVVTRILAA